MLLILRTIKHPHREARDMQKFMLAAIEQSKGNQSSQSVDLPITALLTNPNTSEILLTAHDTRISGRHPLNHPIMLLLNQLPTLLPGNVSAAALGYNSLDEEEQYYAHMYDVYITHEPCTMCCMALVHSRIRRLIFWKSTKTGARALGWMKGDQDGTLNHRYMCFEGIPGALGDDAHVGMISDDVCA